MDEQKVCFIMCANDDMLAAECLLYINNLNVPAGFKVETRVIKGAVSMTAGYNKAMESSDARYKIYLHQDVLIINKNLIRDIVSIFMKNPQLGMLGVIGSKKLGADGSPWYFGIGEQAGEVYVDRIEKKIHVKGGTKISGEYEKVTVLDGILMATQTDIRWREDLFDGWHFYDFSQSLEFWKAGYEVAVPGTDEPWCLHDNDIPDMKYYDKYREIFVKEYGGVL